MKKLEVTFIDNQTHGYLKISRYDLLGMGIDYNKFSKFSYFNYKNHCFYLEEDCDLTLFCKLIKEKGYTIQNEKGYIDCSSICVKPDYFEEDRFVPNTKKFTDYYIERV